MLDPDETPMDPTEIADEVADEIARRMMRQAISNLRRSWSWIRPPAVAQGGIGVAAAATSMSCGCPGPDSLQPRSGLRRRVPTPSRSPT